MLAGRPAAPWRLLDHARKGGAEAVALDDRPTQPFFVILADHDRDFFSVEGLMTDYQPWNDAARNARDRQQHVVRGPAGPDRDALAAEYREANKLARAPPGIPFWRIERRAEAHGRPF
jgi:hypothetical protein